MTILRFSHAELAARLGRSTDAARVLARRKGWQRVTGNDGRVAVLVDAGELGPDSSPERPGRRPPEQAEQRPDTLQPVVDRLRGSLEHALVQSASGWRPCRLRERVGRLEGEAAGHASVVAELHNALADLSGRLDRATAELTEARRSWLERVLAALRR